MEFSSIPNDIKQETIYTLVIPHESYTKARLYPHDRLLIGECEGSNRISDKLLALEMIARRIEGDSNE